MYHTTFRALLHHINVMDMPSKDYKFLYNNKQRGLSDGVGINFSETLHSLHNFPNVNQRKELN